MTSRSYASTRRGREVAVRVALGAKPHEVRRLVVSAGLRPAAAGVVLGLGAAFGVGRLPQLLLEGSPTDRATITFAGAVLVGAAFVASWLPARRAALMSRAEVLPEQ